MTLLFTVNVMFLNYDAITLSTGKKRKIVKDGRVLTGDAMM